MALAALNTSSIPADYLNNFSAGGAIDYEAPILAIAAMGKNPQDFNGRNLADELKNFYASNQLGDPGAINDDIFGLLALAASKISSNDPVAEGTKQFILKHQNSDGGFTYDPRSSYGTASDSSSTAWVV